MIRRFIAFVLSVAVLTVVSFPAHAKLWTITGGELTTWFTKGISGSSAQPIYENGFGTNADFTPTMPTRFNGYNCAGIGGLTDLSCGDDAGEGAVPEVWGAPVSYFGTVDDVAMTGTLSWTGERGTGLRGGTELFTTSITSGSYDLATGIATGTFACWNNPSAVNTYGADFCGNGTGGAIITTAPALDITFRYLTNGMVSFVDNMDGTISIGMSRGDIFCETGVDCPAGLDLAVFASWTLNAITVPVPAAIWLFGSALTFIGWLRRREHR